MELQMSHGPRRAARSPVNRHLLTVEPPPVPADALIKEALKALSDRASSRLEQLALELSAGRCRSLGEPFLNREGLPRRGRVRGHAERTLLRWLERKGVAAEVRALTDYLNGREDLSPGYRWALSATFPWLLAELLARTGVTSRHGIATRLADPETVATEILFALAGDEGPLDEFADLMVEAAASRPGSRLQGLRLEAVKREVRAAL